MELLDMNCPLCNEDKTENINIVCEKCFARHHMKISLNFTAGEEISIHLTFEGAEYTLEQFQRLIKLKVFL